MKEFDAIVIGTGQAGPPLAGKLAEAGRNVAIIEKDKLGGTCVNDGCTPTKAYVASARRAWVAQNSVDLGVSSNEVRVNLSQVKRRKDGIISDSRKGLMKMFDESENIKLYRGLAQFTANHRIEVGGQQLTAKKYLLIRVPELGL